MQSKSSKTTYLSTSEVARLLGVSVGTVQQMVESGELKAWKTAGGHRRILKESVVEMQGVQQNNSVAKDADKTPQVRSNQANKLAILIVEDDPVAIKLYEHLLEANSENVRVEYAHDGIEALLKLGQQRFNLLILDIDIPYVDGYEMLRRISADAHQSSLNILIVTGTSIKPSNIDNEGLTIIEKPINKAFFRGYLQGAIDTHRAK